MEAVDAGSHFLPNSEPVRGVKMVYLRRRQPTVIVSLLIHTQLLNVTCPIQSHLVDFAPLKRSRMLGNLDSSTIGSAPS